MINREESKWNLWLEKHLKIKTKSCQSRRQTSNVERTFENFVWKPS